MASVRAVSLPRVGVGSPQDSKDMWCLPHGHLCLHVAPSTAWSTGCTWATAKPGKALEVFPFSLLCLKNIETFKYWEILLKIPPFLASLEIPVKPVTDVLAFCKEAVPCGVRAAAGGGRPPDSPYLALRLHFCFLGFPLVERQFSGSMNLSKEKTKFLHLPGQFGLCFRGEQT